jgi:predicted lactoylglutathione lyase
VSVLRKNLVRKITTTTAQIFKISMNGNTPQIEELDKITLLGKPTEREILKAVKEKHGAGGSYTIGETTVEDTMYEMAVEDFVALATKIPNKTNS